MSKAFTKEQDGPEEEELDEPSASVAGGKNYITPHGARRLRDELKRLHDVERPEVVRVVSWAASNGDRSENGDYLYGKKKLREIDKRIRFISKRLEAAEIINPLEQKADQVLFGATVTVKNEDEQKLRYQIVGVDEIDISKRRVSWLSPIGKALLQARVGDVVTLRTPKGEEDLEIIKISYEEIGD
jgi:transcription elongation factor GreB